jgi:hypothetical protein
MAIIRRAAAGRQDYGSMTEPVPDRSLKRGQSKVIIAGRGAVMAMMCGDDEFTLAGLRR